MNNSLKARVLVIGAGLAGSEAAMYLARNGVQVVLVEGKTLKLNPAQKIPNFAELVCTNSLKSLDPNSAHGLLKAEMKSMGSFIIESAQKHAVPAGDALAVDRELFSAEVTRSLSSHPNIQVVELEANDPMKLKAQFNCDFVIVAPDIASESKVGGELSLHTSLVVREDSWSLYGFLSQSAKSLFEDSITQNCAA